MLIGTLALTGAGIPGTQIGFAGFFSKDAIIAAAYNASLDGRIGGQMAFWFSIIAAALTSFYSWRLMFMTFEGRYRGGGHDAHAHDANADDPHAREDHGDQGGDEPGAHHATLAHADSAPGPLAPVEAGAAPAHESPLVMLAPLAALAAGAVFAGVLFAPYFIGDHAHEFWRGAVAMRAAPERAVPHWVEWAPVSVTALGFALATVIYLFNQGLGAKIAAAGGPIHAFLYHKWYFDEIYDFVFVKGTRALGDLLWKVGDQRIIDGLGPNGFAWVAKFWARQARRMQTGFIYHYSFVILVAAVAFGAYAIWRAGTLR
jgi:NADH-quinone oxidoreductase subunit L